MRHRTKLGIIGLGHVYDWQAKALELVPGLHVVGGTDTNRDTAQRLVHGRFFDSAQALLAADVQAVLISTPPATHYEIAVQALTAGKDVLIEKPATLDLEKLSDLHALATDAGQLLVVAFHAAFAPDLQWFQKALEAGRFKQHGAIDVVKMSFFDPYITPSGIEPSRMHLGGSWIDSGINALSVLASLVEDAVLMEARATTIPQVSGIDIACAADFAFPTGVTGRRGIATIETNWALGINRKLTSVRFVDGTEVVLDHSGQRVLKRVPGETIQELADCAQGRERLVNHYVGVFEDFIRRLRLRRGNEQLSRVTHRLLFEGRDGAIRA